MLYQNHAVVIGGSIAGLLAGRVLANHFHRVTIIERDFFPPQPAPRPSLPQSRSLHVLLKRGQIILEEFFPGLAEELTAAGAPSVDGTKLALYLSTGKAAPYSDGWECLSFSRDLLDWIIRRRLSQLITCSFWRAAASPHCCQIQDRQASQELWCGNATQYLSSTFLSNKLRQIS